MTKQTKIRNATTASIRPESLRNAQLARAILGLTLVEFVSSAVDSKAEPIISKFHRNQDHKDIK